MNHQILRPSNIMRVFINLLLLGINLLLFGVMHAQSSAYAAVIAPHESGHIAFQETFFDFGTVTEGDVVKHTFRLKNEGNGRATISNVETSCGCTTASGALKAYAPGETGEVEIAVDTKGKKGIVVKTIAFTVENSDVSPVQVSLSMNLVPPPHPKVENARNINTEATCKSCHLESGQGQYGIFLYHRICSQCHGKRGTGGAALALNDPVWQQAPDEYLKKVVREGQPEKGMPSYVTGVTPPLSDEQVNTLIEYIRSLVQR